MAEGSSLDNGEEAWLALRDRRPPLRVRGAV